MNLDPYAGLAARYDTMLADNPLRIGPSSRYANETEIGGSRQALCCPPLSQPEVARRTFRTIS